MLTRFQTSIVGRLPSYSQTLFEAKTIKGLSFEQIASHIGRSEVACAAIFYGQTPASAEDVDKLADLLQIPKTGLAQTVTGFPDRGRSGPMPPVEPLIYRLYEIVQNYGYAYKAVMNEKFGDGIMSAICFSTKVEKEVDEQGTWAVITMRGKWQVIRLAQWRTMLTLHILKGFLSVASRFGGPGRQSGYGFGCPANAHDDHRTLEYPISH